MLRMNAAERRARLGLRHRLAGGAQAGDPVEAARSMVAVHSTDPSSVYLGLLARMDGGGLADVERALYDRPDADPAAGDAPHRLRDHAGDRAGYPGRVLGRGRRQRAPQAAGLAGRIRAWATTSTAG